MTRFLPARKGFTLIELMIVITVIAILVTIAIVSFTRVQQQARDTKRKAEIRTISQALHAYNADHGQYPVAATCTLLAAVTTPASFTDYLQTMPTAPVGATAAQSTYLCAVNATQYSLCITLESPRTAANPVFAVTGAQTGGRELAACPGAE